VIEKVKEILNAIKSEIAKVIIGNSEVVDLLLMAVLVRGHILIEGVPGTGKTLLVKTLARILRANFKRVQMTPDLMPSDIIGTRVFDQKVGAFAVHKGPVFTNFLLADEINRAPAKTQSALLEAMEESQVTIEGERFKLPDLFMVLATQNPIEYEGTYPLPEAQLDRFLFKVTIGYPTVEDEKRVLAAYEKGFRAQELESVSISELADETVILNIQRVLRQIGTKDTLRGYVTSIVGQTRTSSQVAVGAGPRASIAILLASKARALLDGRDFTTPDDIKFVSPAVLRHRVVLRPEVEIEGLTTDAFIANVLSTVHVPR
jgi:MoxR-like ATPase